MEKNQTTLILLNTHPAQGNTTHGLENLTTEEGMEYLIRIGNEDESRILVDSYYDVHQYLYAHKLGMIDKKNADGKKDQGIYDELRLPLNKELTVPFTGEVIPFSDYETGKLREGTTDLNSAAYDSLADYKISYEEGVVEVRIPWQLIGFTDPSTMEIMGDVYKDGIESRLNINEISFVGISVKSGKESTSVNTQNGIIRKDELHTYTWNEWTEPVVKERLKESYPIIRELFSRY
ncbi:hypothetical protein [Proteiniclasticum sp.]|uniref:hypothetical protein n=1 Tax=Proteiniclasticum sp. TaxID=2053595 RepID=UPI00289A8DDF|nr:hypothetical protein [Proteiniclasticum sp.]